MAAGLGFKDFVTGEVLTAADVDGYLMQGVWVFASAAARDAAVTSPQEGNFAYLKDTNVTTYYTGSAWANLDTTGMTNPMTTTGDVIYSSPGSTPVRLGIGTANQVLRVNSGATAPEWATVGGSGFTLIGTTTFSASSAINVNDVFSATYSNYLLRADFVNSANTVTNLRFRVSGSDNTTANYNMHSMNVSNATVTAFKDPSTTSFEIGVTAIAGTFMQMSFFNPFETAKTGAIMDSILYAGTGIEQQHNTFQFNATTSFTGFSLLPQSGTMTGTLRVYGLAN